MSDDDLPSLVTLMGGKCCKRGVEGPGSVGGRGIDRRLGTVRSH